MLVKTDTDTFGVLMTVAISTLYWFNNSKTIIGIYAERRDKEILLPLIMQSV